MFESLTDRFEGILSRLRSRGRLTDDDVDEVLREIRTALLEADVEIGVVRGFTDAVRQRCVGLELVQNLSPGQQVIKIVNEELVGILGGETLKITYAGRPPTVILLAGLQGSGKTTTSAKLARWFKQQGRNPLLVGADLQRPAAVEQLRVLGEQAGISVFSEATDPVAVATSRSGGGQAPRPRRAHRRHRRSAGHRRGPDGRDPAHRRGGRSPLHLPGHRRHDRPGRRGDGRRLPPGPRRSTGSS